MFKHHPAVFDDNRFDNRFSKIFSSILSFLRRVVSTQMCPELTMKVMVHESETYTKVGNDEEP